MESFPKKVTTELRYQGWLGIYQAKQREEVQKTSSRGSGRGEGIVQGHKVCMESWKEASGTSRETGRKSTAQNPG